MPKGKLIPERLAPAIDAAAHDPAMRQRAQVIGAGLAEEDDLGVAVDLIEAAGATT